MKNALKCEARASERTKQFFISLRKVKTELLEGTVPFYYYDHCKNLPQRDKTTFHFHYFQLTKTFLSFSHCICKTEAIIHTYLAALIEDM